MSRQSVRNSILRLGGIEKEAEVGKPATAAPDTSGSTRSAATATVASIRVVTNQMTVPHTVASKKTEPGTLRPTSSVNFDIQQRNSKAPPHAAAARPSTMQAGGSPRSTAPVSMAVPAVHNAAVRKNVR